MRSFNMAFQITNFVDPLPRLSDSNWFSLDERLDDDALLAQEEEEYKLLMKEITDKGFDLVSIGQTKETTELPPDCDEGEIEDEGEDEESGGELDDETDEYDTSPGALAAILAGGQEVEMTGTNAISDETEPSLSWI